MKHDPAKPLRVVYFVEQDGAPTDFRFVKIGTTSERVGAKTRLSTLQTGSPFEISIIGEIPERWFGREGSEAFWHSVYKRFRHAREWFLLPLEEVEKLRALLADRKQRSEAITIAECRRAADRMRQREAAKRLAGARP